MSLMTSVVQGGAKLRDLTKEKGTQKERVDTDTGDSTDIFVYQYQHSGGICFLYDNQSNKNSLDEEVQFKLTGLQIDG